jgi:DNA-directed RNA polymerase subunit omega
MKSLDAHEAAAWLNAAGNRYRLILRVAERARELENGAAPMVQPNGDKPLGIALREIAEGKLSPDITVKSSADIYFPGLKVSR